MVVLALILVLVAPNVLDAMNQSKKSAMKTYAKRMINEAKTKYELDKLNSTTGFTGTRTYPIKNALATDQNQYVGCVQVNTSNNEYTVIMVDTQNKYYLKGVGSGGVDSATIDTANNNTATADNAVVITGSTKCPSAVG